MKMLRWLAVSLFLLSMTVGASAQNNSKKIKLTPQQRTESMANTYSLTSSQKKKVLQLNKDYDAYFESNTKTAVAKKKEYNKKLNNILTDEQKAKMKRSKGKKSNLKKTKRSVKATKLS